MCRQLRGLIETSRQSGMCWRSAIDSLRPVSNRIWQELSAEDRRRFVRHLKTYWEAHRHRMAPEVRSLMDRFEKNGAVEVLAGRLRETRRSGNAIAVRIALRQGRERLLDVDRVINCTGIHESYVDRPRPLIASLIRNALARANDLGIGFRTDSHGALIDASDGPSPMLFTLGPPRRGRGTRAASDCGMNLYETWHPGRRRERTGSVDRKQAPEGNAAILTPPYCAISENSITFSVWKMMNVSSDKARFLM
jgi:uncharacterized NAD(P)/FAD-binding protein YdhS